MRIKPFILWSQGVFLLPVLTLRFERGTEGLTGKITLKPALIHWATTGMSLLMVGFILISPFSENFEPI